MQEKFFIGVDEAGYGPNLGPLVVAGSLWSAPATFSEQHFLDKFAPTFSASPWTTACQHIPLGDSKQLYQPRSGLLSLESGLLAMSHLQTQQPWSNLGIALEQVSPPDQLAELRQAIWYRGYEDLPIPISHAGYEETQRLATLARNTLNNWGVKLISLRASLVPERQFNASLAQVGSKGYLLSYTTLELVKQLLSQANGLSDAAVEVFCDRQGGRKNYLPCLINALPDEWFTETASSPLRSSYRNCGNRPLCIHFSVGGDSFPPTALASMLAKYLRERLMEQLNAFWRAKLPRLKPTAGYPLDAKRFRCEIETLAAKLELPVDSWWRKK